MFLYCSKDAATQEVTSCTRYWSIHSPGKADAKPLGVDNVIDKDSVLVVEDRPVVIRGATDGASVMLVVGDHTGLKAQCSKLCDDFLVLVLCTSCGIGL